MRRGLRSYRNRFKPVRRDAGLRACPQGQEAPAAWPFFMSEEKQFLCSHLVAVVWTGGRTSANMEKIWPGGATLNSEEALEPGTRIRLEAPEFTLETRVVHCKVEDDGYFVDVAFEPGYRWTPEHFEPAHLTDPDILLVRKLLSEMSER